MTFTTTEPAVPGGADVPPTITWQGAGPLQQAPRSPMPFGLAIPAYFQGSITDTGEGDAGLKSLTLVISAPSIIHPLGLGAPDPGGFGYEITYNGIPLVLSSNGVNTGGPGSPTGSVTGSSTLLDVVLPAGETATVEVALADAQA